MNRGQINGFALNRVVADPVVRIQVDAKGYARVRVGGRVLVYAISRATPAAVLDGRLGRVKARLVANALARAAIAGALARVDVHGLLSATGRAVIKVTLPPVYARVKAAARVGIGIQPRTLVHGAAAALGRARLTPKTWLLRRGPVQARGRADIKADGVVYVRRWLRSPTEGKGLAFVVSTSRAEVRLAALVRAQAMGAVDFHIAARAPMALQAVAFIEIDPAIHKRLPFDEPTPDARTFDVPEIMTTFNVSEQGDAVFRTPPMQPADTQDYDINFDKFFPPGDEIVGVSLEVVPAMSMPPSYAFEGQRVKVWIYAGGTSGQKYKVSATATTNDGRVKQVELIVPIKEV